MSPVKPPRTPEQGGETLQSLAALKKASPTPEARPAGENTRISPVPLPEVRASGSSTGAMPVLSPERRPAGSTMRTPPVPPPEVRASGSSAGPSEAKAEQEAGTSPGLATGRGEQEKPAKRNYPALAAALQTLGYSVPGFVASAVVGLDGTPIAQVAVDDLDISAMCAHFSQVMQGVLQALEEGRRENCEYTLITSRTQHILLRQIGNKGEAFQVLITARETNPTESLEVMANVEAAISASLN
jgi:predicted regulator of Ras-like GTPase activity (Roadblock/LC7/MglB family)